jgi:Ferritin-like domain
MKGDKAIVDILNGLPAGELTAVDPYLIHGEMYSDIGFTQLATKALHESDHERQHVRALILRILFLGGTPDLARRESMTIGGTVPEKLEANLAVEYKVVGASGPAGSHSGPPRASRRVAMTTPFRCPGRCPARNVGATRGPVAGGVGFVGCVPNCAAMGAVLEN